MKKPIIGLVACCALVSFAHAQSTPTVANNNPAVPVAAANTPAVQPLLQAYPRTWQLQGQGTLRFGPFDVYTATLHSTGNFKLGEDAVLDITYRRSVDADSIINTSIIEIGRLNAHTPEQLNAWSAAIRKAAVAVKAGDRLTGVFLKDYGVRFFLNDKPIHEVRGPEFSNAYLNIWLHENAKDQRLRRELLGLSSARRAQSQRN
jgi:Chalcone isomerase-like